jgi:hypothetical protein
MVHLTGDQVRRYLEKRLTRSERVSASEHLAACEQCRAQVTQSPEFQRLASRGITALTGITREKKLPRLPFRELTGTERLAIDMHEDLCPSVLVDGERNESTEPQWPDRAERPGYWWRQIFAGRPWGIATGAAAALAIIVWFAHSREGGGKLVTIRDADKEFKIGAHGLIGTYLSDAAVSRKLNTDVARMLNHGELTAPGAVRALRDGSSQFQHSASASDTLIMQRPVRTVVDSETPMFQWAAHSNARGYVVKVVSNDRFSREVATSTVIPAAGSESSLYQWRLPENTPLARGQTYLWYVTILVNDSKGVSSPVDETAAKFSVLSKDESENLAGLKKQAGGSEMVAGLLDLQAGLLDDAEQKFDNLRQKEDQTDEGRALLGKFVAKVKTLKDDH